MSGGRKQRLSRLLALVGGLCIPLAALAWSSPASAATLAGVDLGGLIGQSVSLWPGCDLHRHIDDLGLGQP